MGAGIEARSLNHVGIAVRSIDAQRHYHGSLGRRVLAQPASGVAFDRVGDVRLKLLEPLGDSGRFAFVVGAVALSQRLARLDALAGLDDGGLMETRPPVQVEVDVQRDGFGGGGVGFHGGDCPPRRDNPSVTPTAISATAWKSNSLAAVEHRPLASGFASAPWANRPHPHKPDTTYAPSHLR